MVKFDHSLETNRRHIIYQSICLNAGREGIPYFDEGIGPDIQRIADSPLEVRHEMRFQFLKNHYLRQSKVENFDSYHDIYYLPIEKLHEISNDALEHNFNRMMNMFQELFGDRRF